MIVSSVTKRKDNSVDIASGRITEKGIDFLQPDGGLSALAAPVIRITPENLTALVDAALEKRGVSQEEQSIIRKSLEEAGPEAMRVIVQRLIDAGCTHMPKLLNIFIA
jgi:hypothetical protein